MKIAFATYKCCRYGVPTQVQEIELPADRLTPTAVDSFLRFGGRISNRVLDHFNWEGSGYELMGDAR